MVRVSDRVQEDNRSRGKRSGWGEKAGERWWSGVSGVRANVVGEGDSVRVGGRAVLWWSVRGLAGACVTWVTGVVVTR